MENLKRRKYAATIKEAKAIFKAKTGEDYKPGNLNPLGVKIFKARKKSPWANRQRRFMVCTHLEWLNT